MRIAIFRWPPGTNLVVRIHSASGSSPGAVIATLANPSRAVGALAFTALDNVQLASGTTYRVTSATRRHTPAARQVLSSRSPYGKTIQNTWAARCNGKFHAVSKPGESTPARFSWPPLPQLQRKIAFQQFLILYLDLYGIGDMLRPAGRI